MIGPAAQSEIEVSGIAIGRNVAVPRDANRREGVVREQANRAVQSRTVEVAGEAVAFLRIVVDGKSPPLLRREVAADLVARIPIVLAGIGVEAVVLELKRLERLHRVAKRAGRVREDAAPERVFELVRIRRDADPGDDLRGVAIRHLVGGQQRNPRLIGQRWRAPVERQPAPGTGLADPVRVVEQIAVGRRVFAVAQGRHRTGAAVTQRGTSRPHGKIVGRSIRKRRIVTCGAGHPPGGRQGSVEEQFPSNPRRRARACGCGGEADGAERQSGQDEGPAPGRPRHCCDGFDGFDDTAAAWSRVSAQAFR